MNRRNFLVTALKAAVGVGAAGVALKEITEAEAAGYWQNVGSASCYWDDYYGCYSNYSYEQKQRWIACTQAACYATNQYRWLFKGCCGGYPA